ncbi:hypothetical protein V7S76_12540 [Aquirufa sp. ROCK2-A2]
MFRKSIFLWFFIFGFIRSNSFAQIFSAKGNFPLEVKAWILSSKNREAPMTAEKWLKFYAGQTFNTDQKNNFEKLVLSMPNKGFKSGYLAYLFFRCTVQFEKSPETLQNFLLVWEKLLAAKDVKTGLLLVEQIENWQFNQFIPALGNMQLRVRGDFNIYWPKKEEISKVDTSSKINVADSWDTPSSNIESEIPQNSEEIWIKSLYSEDGPMLTWANPSLLYRTGKDSLTLAPESFVWSVKSKIGFGKKVEISGNMLAHPKAIWHLDEFEIVPNKGALNGLKGNWKDSNERMIAGQGQMRIKRKSNSLIFPFEFKANQDLSEPVQNEHWRANGRMWILGDRVGLMSFGKTYAFFEVFSDKDVLARIKTPTLWIYPDQSVQIAEGQYLSKIGAKDSLIHAHVKAKWFPKEQLLHIRKQEGTAADRLFFEDSYHQIRISADLAVVSVADKKVDFFRIAAKAQNPAWVESFDYFEEERIRVLQDILPFNPLRILYNYFMETKSSLAYLTDIAIKNKRDLKELQPSFIRFAKAGYFQYSSQTDQISFTRLGRHYANVMFAKKDFDRFFVASLADQIPKDTANITLYLTNKSLKVRGIDEVVVSDSLKANFIPKDHQIVFSNGRDFDFNGEIKIGNYRFRGPDFKFNFGNFTVNFDQIDSITFLPKLKNGDIGTKELGGQFKYESGSLVLSPPNNKSGRLGLAAYPKLIIPKGVTAYFDEPWRAEGLYASSKFYFKVPKIELDSLLQKQITFEGSFYSEGLIPTIKTNLELMPDQSFGFNYLQKSPVEIYKNQGKFQLQGPMVMDKMGLHAAGNLIVFGVHSDSKISRFYPDSLIVNSSSGKIVSSFQGKNIFPQATMEQHDLRWIPSVDSLIISPIKSKIALYQGSTQLEGPLKFHQKKVFGSGKLFFGEGTFVSDQYSFTASNWQTNEASFQIGRNMKLFKPLVFAKSISAETTVGSNKVSIKSAKNSDKDFSESQIIFPHLAYQSTISEALWDLSNQRFKLSGKKGFELTKWSSDTTQTESDSLSKDPPLLNANAESQGLILANSADYDLKAQYLQLGGVKQVAIGPAFVYPSGGLLGIQKDGKFKPFSEAKAILDPENSRHKLENLTVVEANADYWKGTANYLLPRASGDSIQVPLRQFEFSIIPASGNKQAQKQVKAEANFGEKRTLAIGLHQQFKGDVVFESQQEFLQFKGFIRPELGLKNIKSAWIPFEPKLGDSPNLKLDENLRDESGRPVTAGIFINADNKLYPTFLSPVSDDLDPVLFSAKGTVEEQKDHFQVFGNTSVMKLFSKEKRIETQGAVELFTGNKLLKSFGNISMSTDTLIPRIESWLSLQFPFPATLLKVMGDRMVKFNLDEGLMSTSADEPETRDEYLIRVALLLNKDIPEVIKNKMDKEHLALDKVSPDFAKSINFSSVKWTWSPNTSSFYTTESFPLVNVGPVDVNNMVKGYMEVIKKPSKEEFYAYWELSEDLWYYFAYFNGELGVYSSDNSFLAAIRESVKENKKEADVRVVEAASDEKDAFLKKFTSYYRKIVPTKKATTKTPEKPKEKEKAKPKVKSKQGGF